MIDEHLHVPAVVGVLQRQRRLGGRDLQGGADMALQYANTLREHAHGAVPHDDVRHAREVADEEQEVVRLQQQVVHHVLGAAERAGREALVERELRQRFSRVLVRRPTRAAVRGHEVGGERVAAQAVLCVGGAKILNF
jgi:hypothetical protein